MAIPRSGGGEASTCLRATRYRTLCRALGPLDPVGTVRAHPVIQLIQITHACSSVFLKLQAFDEWRQMLATLRPTFTDLKLTSLAITPKFQKPAKPQKLCKPSKSPKLRKSSSGSAPSY